ncbi:glutamyl-tRNA reductase [Metallibacterium scheffleri]|jgi:glutamyl-tRNA reductase|uniref:glutamyl-tRNA reductase n=2 Tax=Metallibacterium TaxID=1218803 RepID=UPI0026F32A78|nr:glutamyl-tRNA reductase [Metallibacterium scheffleri]MBW8074946.1 glutamyl-tRNA reductase [Metallibacterium scheffleri]
MRLIAYGLDHQTAPLALREQVAIADAMLPEALRELRAQPGVEEALILSTCNRTELYCSVHEGAEPVPAQWLHARHCLPAGRLDDMLRQWSEREAVRHLFRVATGLESMVLGEPQILGQLKEAYQHAHTAGTLDVTLERLLQNTFAVAKRVRTDTGIGTQPVSVAYTAVRLAERLFTDIAHACVLLIGAGETIELAARHLSERRVARLTVVNRTVGHALALVQRTGGLAAALSDLPAQLAEADIVISSTASPAPIIDRAMVQQALARRRHRPMFMVDLAVPRDIAAEVAELRDVFVYSIDDLRQVVDEGRRVREAAAEEAQTLIELQVERFCAWRKALAAHNPVQTLRQAAAQQRDEVLARAQAMIAHGKSPDEALAFLANTLTNKLLHTPSVKLREAAEQGDTELLRAAARLYGCPANDDPPP